jgi:ribonuclease III
MLSALQLWIARHFGPKAKIYKRFKEILGFYPRDIAYYTQAITLPHQNQEKADYIASSYERLEFLGDAVLQLVVTDYIFRHYPHFDEGEMTELRAKVVNTDYLVEMAQRLLIPSLLELIPQPLPKRNDYLADIVEALIGAIYMDRGPRYAHRFIHKRLFPLIRWKEVEQTEFNYKGKLLEYVQQRQLGQIEFQLQERRRSRGEDYFVVCIKLNNQIISYGTGSRKKEAEQQAARTALKLLSS